ncbi:unnamed protein product, partial [Allacma fusca]
ARNFRFFEYW